MLKRAALLCMLVPSLACAARRAPVGAGLFPMTTVWTAPLGESIEGPLAADDRRVFVATRDGAVRALDRDTGAEVWKVAGPSRRLVSEGHGGVLVRGVDGAISKLAPLDGRVLWTSDSGIKGDIPALAHEELVIVAGEGLAVLEAATGRLLWAQREPVVSAPPTVLGLCLLVGEADGTLRCRDRGTGASLWAYHTRSALVAAPVADAAGRLFLGTTDRRMVSLNPANGHQRWRFKVGADVQNVAAVLGNRVFVAAYDAVLYAFDAGNGNMAWRTPLPSRPLSAPVVTRGILTIACRENDLLGFDPRTGRRIGGLKAPALFRTAPLLNGGRLFVGLRDRTVQALEFPPEPPTIPSPTTRPAGSGRHP